MVMLERADELDALILDFARDVGVLPTAEAASVVTGAPGELAPGFLVGHWTGDRTGVTVVLCPPEHVASGEVRGGAPATRETALLEPPRTVEHVDAVVLTGGSAFGLAAADGVMRASRSTAVASRRRAGPFPIVPTAAIFDLVESGERPGAAEGRAAVAAADARRSDRDRKRRRRTRRDRREVARPRARGPRRARRRDRRPWARRRSARSRS